MSYNTNLQNKNLKLQEILNTINSLPEGSGGTDTSDATASADDVAEGETFYANGEKVTGTFTIADEISEQRQLLSELETILANKGSISCTLYVGSTAPTDDVGIDGDIYIVREV